MGYPVGVVNRVGLEPGKPFADVFAKPNAHLDRSSHVLLVFTESRISAETNGSAGKGDDRGG